MFELVGNPIWVWVGVLSVYPNFNSGDKKARWKNSIKSKVVNCDFIKCGNIGNFGGCCEVEFAYNNYLGGNQWWLWELEPDVYDGFDHVNVWFTGSEGGVGLKNEQLNISYCRNNLIHDNVYDGANPAFRPGGPDSDCLNYISLTAGGALGGTMENIRVYNNTYRNQRNLPGWESIEFWSVYGAHAEDIRIYDNDIQDIRAGRNGIFAVTFRDPLFPDFWGSSENISIVGNTFSSGETTEIGNGIWAAFMPNALFARNNYKNGNYLPYDPDDPAIMNRMPVFLMFCENCIVDEVGGFPSGESGQPLNWIVDLGGINNRIIGSPAATPEEVPPGIGNMLSDQKKAEMEQLRRIR